MTSPASDFSPWGMTVREICQSLGWGGDSGTPRCFKTLSHQVTKFRKRYSAKQEFPIDSNSDRVRQCAADFCDRDLRRKEYFVPCKDSDQPSLPQDREKILKDLSKLLCIQEYYRRRNEETKLRRATRKNKGKGRASDEDDDDDDDDDYDFGEDEADDDDDISEYQSSDPEKSNDEQSTIVVAPASSVRTAADENTAASESTTKKDREMQNRAAIRYNIEQHLNYVYSLSRSPKPAEKETPSLDDPRLRWILESNTTADWPEEYKIVAWRFMHANDLYTLSPSIRELDRVGSLVEVLLREMNLTGTVDATRHAVVFEKVKKFVIYSTRKFIRDYGLLQQFENSMIARTPEFDHDFKIQRETYLRIHRLSPTMKQRPSPNTPNPTATPSSSSPVAIATSSHKRVNSANAAVASSVQLFSDYKEFVTKRQRTVEESISRGSGPSPASAPVKTPEQRHRQLLPASSLTHHHGLPQTMAGQPEPARDQYTSPPGGNPNRIGTMPSVSTPPGGPPRLLPGFRQQERTQALTPESVDERGRARTDPNVNRVASRAPSPYLAARVPHMYQASHQSSRQSSPSGAHSISSIAMEHLRPLSRQSSSSSIGLANPMNDTRLSSPYLRPSSVASSEASYVPDPSDPQDIIFILHNRSGVLDFDDPVPFHVFRNTQTTAWFTLYSQRSGIPLEKLTKLTFTVVFAKHLTFVMTRDEDDQSWRRFKKRIGSLFLLTKERRPTETDFEVWVDAGEVADF